MAGVLVASVLLGFAYNAASPLGVRSSTSATTSGLSATQPAKIIPATGYFNETVSLTIEGVEGALAKTPRPPSGSAVGETGQGAGVPLVGAPSVPTLTWPEVKTLLKSSQVLLIDARVASYYQAGHISEAISLPANSPPADIANFATQHSKNTAIVIYCGSVSCPMAHQLANVLVGQHGFSNIKVMPGGFAEYRTAEAQVGQGAAR
jgi:rhodanese-related sulfurtransferase